MKKSARSYQEWRGTAAVFSRLLTLFPFPVMVVFPAAQRVVLNEAFAELLGPAGGRVTATEVLSMLEDDEAYPATKGPSPGTPERRKLSVPGGAPVPCLLDEVNGPGGDLIALIVRCIPGEISFPCLNGGDPDAWGASFRELEEHLRLFSGGEFLSIPGPLPDDPLRQVKRYFNRGLDHVAAMLAVKDLFAGGAR
jgi:hypothetical protein